MILFIVQEKYIRPDSPFFYTNAFFRQAFRIIILNKFDQFFPNINPQIPGCWRIFGTHQCTDFYTIFFRIRYLKHINFSIPKRAVFKQSGKFSPDSIERNAIININKNSAQATQLLFGSSFGMACQKTRLLEQPGDVYPICVQLHMLT